MVVSLLMVSFFLLGVLLKLRRGEEDLLLDFRTTPAPGRGAERRAGPHFLMVALVRGILVGGVDVRV